MPPLTLTILGSGPAAPNPGGVCSGYLVRQGQSAVLLDCGPGVAGRIPLHVPVNRLTGVAISHLHPDHYFDLVQLYYMLKFGERRPADWEPRLEVYVPPGGRAFFGRLGSVIADQAEMLDDVLDIQEYEADEEMWIGGLAFSFHQVQHYIMSHAMRVQGETGARLVFSSDVAPCSELIEVAEQADLFLCESALLDAAQDGPDPSRRGHLSAADAGEAARAAGVKRLLITHYRSSEAHDAHHLAAARATFSGPVDLARDGTTITIG